MASKKPLKIGPSGINEEFSATDTVAPTHGGTGKTVSDLAGQSSKMLAVNATEDGYDLVSGGSMVAILVTDPQGAAIATGDGKAYFRVNEYLNGMNLITVGASVSTGSSSGALTIQVRRVRSGSPVDMLSTPITIDVSETDSSTAAAAVINTSNDDLATADQIFVDIDAAGTDAKGLCITLVFQSP